MNRQYGDIVVFTTLYLFFSLPPFLVFNRGVLSEIRARLAPIDVVAVAVLGTVALVVLTGLVVAREGVNRYNQFLTAPTDVPSAVVALSFLLAATAWWLVPEVVFRFEMGLSFDLLLVAVLFCQIPMLLFLSLLTAVGKA
ncbi:hypothetical protein GRX03_02950 [Halovenus sp. WSH3]|uniref:Uncharacterized protein n=1 Tax=Halovenus carboxidivorans TaxID=2692199 RepID=A0A6B0T003_9EURY|nr:hypothetical protein [Halovenus carboxidivorans]MXR50567.1 hypothetical protein [Halovenus carboxidivorans]